MHLEILSSEQLKILPYLKQFNRTFYMVGGTAIALHLGHRRSIDFDLFTFSPLKKSVIRQKIDTMPFKQVKLFEDYDQIHYTLEGIKTTFFSFPYKIEHTEQVEQYITIPTLLQLAAMKSFALGRRSKWKDYVDLYFIIKDFYNIQEISAVASNIFGYHFSEKLFRQQLAFHKDIDYSDKVEFLTSPIQEDEIKAFLIEAATDI
jgi:hypothetical protein